MEDYETPDPEFVKGFNEGYTLARHLPELSKQLAVVKGDNPRSAGFEQGREQFTTEQKRERYPAWLKSDRLDKSVPPSDKTKGRDVEPER